MFLALIEPPNILTSSQEHRFKNFMKILHISPIRHHPCFDELVKEQKKNHSLIFVELALTDEDKSYKVVRSRYGVCIENVKKSQCYQYDYKLIGVLDQLFRIYKPQLIHIQVFSGISLLPILNAASSLGIKKILTLHDHSLFCLRGVCLNDHKKCFPDALTGCGCPECLQHAKNNHLSLVHFNKLRTILTEQIIHQSDKIICPSHHQREQLVRLFGERDKFITLYYGVKLDPPPSQKKMSSKTTFGYLGSLAWNKGVSLIETALDKLKDYDFKILMGLTCHPQIPLEADCLDKLKNDKKIKLKLNMKRKELYNNFFSQIDYLIIPSLWNETGPMVLFESFYYKVPVIISDNPSMREKIKENRSSMVFNDADELAGIMSDIMARKIRKKAGDRFPVTDIHAYTREILGVYQESLAKRVRGLFLRLGLACNNHCIFCVTGSSDSREAFDFETVKKILKKNKNRYDSLVLTGGEPTVRKDFLRILDFAYTLGYGIMLQTNARMFAFEKFCKRIQHYNLGFSININGPNAKIHDATTQVPGSFRQTIYGIKNLQKLDANILVKILLTKINCPHLLETTQFVTKLGIKKIWFVFLTPYGSAQVHFNAVVPTLTEVTFPLIEAMQWLRKNTEVKVGLEGFPYCCLSPEFHPFVTEAALTESSLDGLIPESNRQIYNCKRERIFNQKQKFSGCPKCLYDKRCEGVYREYVKRIGQQEFSPIIDYPEYVFPLETDKK